MAAFATAADIETRAMRSLSAAEEALVEMLLDAVGDEILEAVGRDGDWFDDLDETGKAFLACKGASIEAINRVLANPNSAESMQEQLGSYSYSQGFRKAAVNAGLYLSDLERRRIRKAVYGRNVVSSRMESVVSEVFTNENDPFDPVQVD